MQTRDESRHHPKTFRRTCQVRGRQPRQPQQHSRVPLDSSLVDRLTKGRRTPAGWKQLVSVLFTDRTKGLPTYFVFERVYAEWRAKEKNFAVFLLDIRRFAWFNERRGGHARGNELLANFA